MGHHQENQIGSLGLLSCSPSIKVIGTNWSSHIIESYRYVDAISSRIYNLSEHLNMFDIYILTLYVIYEVLSIRDVFSVRVDVSTEQNTFTMLAW